jgi:hypothetical protein
MIAPQVVVVERLHRRIDRNYAGPCRVECDGGDVLSVDVVLFNHQAHRANQGLHLVCMRLRGIVRIVSTASQWIFGRGRPQPAARAVEQGHSYAQGSEVDARNNGHFSLSGTVKLFSLH